MEVSLLCFKIISSTTATEQKLHDQHNFLRAILDGLLYSTVVIGDVAQNNNLCGYSNNSGIVSSLCCDCTSEI